MKPKEIVLHKKHFFKLDYQNYILNYKYYHKQYVQYYNTN